MANERANENSERCFGTVFEHWSRSSRCRENLAMCKDGMLDRLVT